MEEEEQKPKTKSPKQEQKIPPALLGLPYGMDLGRLNQKVNESKVLSPAPPPPVLYEAWRLIRYIGPMESLQRQLASSLHGSRVGMRDVLITAYECSDMAGGMQPVGVARESYDRTALLAVYSQLKRAHTEYYGQSDRPMSEALHTLEMLLDGGIPE